MCGSKQAEGGGPVDHHPSVQSGAARWAVGHTEEFCVKVLKFEIVNSRKLFNYFSEVVLRTIETALPVMLFPGRFKNGRFKNREVSTRSLSQN